MMRLLHERLKDDANEWEERNEWEEAQRLRGMADEIEKYYIPRPRFDDGKPVHFGDNAGELHHIDTIAFYEGGNVSLNSVDDEIFISVGEFVKRPTPKVLYADGVEIKVGDTVYNLENDGEQGTVRCFYSYGLGIEWSGGWRSDGVNPQYLTHEKPVFDADGVPCKSNDEVWSTNKEGVYEEGDMMIVVGIDAGVEEKQVLVRRALGGAGEQWVTAKYLTHEKPVFDAEGVRICKGDTVYDVDGINTEPMRVLSYGDALVNVMSKSGIEKDYEFNELTHREPDTLERIEDDATLEPICYYHKCIGEDSGNKTDADVIEAMVYDLLRRQREVLKCDQSS